MDRDEMALPGPGNTLCLHAERLDAQAGAAVQELLPEVQAIPADTGSS
jgi:hypothetical protein